MNISYTGRHFDIDGEMKDYIEKRLQKVKFYFSQIIQVNIIMEKERVNYVVEIKVSANHDVYFAKESTAEWKEAVDLVTDKIEHEVKKKMDKIKDHHQTSELS
ncbi:MAG: ribosome-associated translation inhibitor RaiA [Brevinematales bacterium]|nr:ribosome-associated translation inhibitor RaiA [Brevinematales bacterium]